MTSSFPPPNRRLSVNAMCTYPWSFDEDLATWREAGLGQAGLLMAKLQHDAEACMDRLTAAGIMAATLITQGFDLSAPDVWKP
ncbi:hypothetical protein J2W40_004103 [Sphingobium xenophagum]|uniref:Uncharacterized protein n=1 Tax=Sphingobium xenophagum TaxID=121428 RepID=A0ABU1X6Q8_SPHXE|nr:hypothetical protein [Sphingobium xenophagum]MDR7157255.1 hypothetical protein [Sphingobium xenophagum]